MARTLDGPLGDERPNGRRFRMRLMVLLWLTLFTFPVFASAQPGAKGPAVPWLKGIAERARELATRSVKAGSPAEAKWQADVKATIDEMLDWDELTRRSLGSEWSKLTERERGEFSALLREMVEASYTSKLKLHAKGELKKPADVKLTWEPEAQSGEDEATAVVHVDADKSRSTLTIQLKHASDRWRVYDIAIDDVSTLRTYRSQFRKLIAERGFVGLLERMRQKTKEIRAGLADL